LRLRLAVALGATAAEPEEPASARRHAPIHPDEPHDQEERGAEAEEHVLPEGPTLIEGPRVDGDVLLLEECLETGVGEGGQQRLEAERGPRIRPLARVGHLLLESALDRIALTGHLLDVPRLHLLLEERVWNVHVARFGGERPHERPVGDHDDEDGEPPGLRSKLAPAPALGGRRRRATARCVRHSGNDTGTAMPAPEGTRPSRTAPARVCGGGVVDTRSPPPSSGGTEPSTCLTHVFVCTYQR